MRASYGTTKYCMAFLRGVSCSDHSCMNLHEWGDETDCFTKEDLTTLFVALLAVNMLLTNLTSLGNTRSRIQRVECAQSQLSRRATKVKVRSYLSFEISMSYSPSAGLPRAASWANKGLNSVASTALHNMAAANQAQPAISRQPRRPTSTRPTRIGVNGSGTPATPSIREKRAAASSNKTPSASSLSRPSTPSVSVPQHVESQSPITPSNPQKERIPSPPPPPSPVAVESDDAGSGEREASRPSSSPEVSSPSPASAPAAPPGLPAVPPGLSAPPGLPAPASRSSLSTESSPQLAHIGPYQMSTQAQALVADLKARRENTVVSSGPSPFPDFDRMLQSLTEDSGFSFSLDPKLAGEDQGATLDLPDFDLTGSTSFSGTFFDAFPSVRHGAPPGLGYPPRLDMHASTQSPAPSTTSSYTGSFNPFGAESNDDSSRQYSPLDDDRKVSRFGFARGRQGSTSMSNTASPLNLPSTLNGSEHAPQLSYFNQSEIAPSAGPSSPAQWNYQGRHHPHDYLHQSNSALSSPLVQHAQAHTPYATPQQQQQQQPARFQPFDTSVSEAQLRDFINSSRDRSLRSSSAGRFSSHQDNLSALKGEMGWTDSQQYKYPGSQPFADPAIMSARLASPMGQPMHDNGYPNLASIADSYSAQQPMTFGPPPGLSFPPGVMPSPSMASRHGLSMGGGLPTGMDLSQAAGSVHGEFRFLHSQGRESQVRVPSAVLSVRKLYHRP